MKNILIIFFFPVFLFSADFKSKWSNFESKIKTKFQSFDNNIKTSFSNFESSCNGKLDAWTSNFKRSLDDFEARTNNKMESTFTNMERDLDAFEKGINDHLDSTFDKTCFDDFEKSIDDTCNRSFDTTREDFKDMKNSLQNDLGEDYSTISDDVDALQSSIDTEGQDLADSMDEGSEEKAALDEAADEAEAEADENTPDEGEGGSTGGGGWETSPVGWARDRRLPITNGPGTYVIGGQGGVWVSGAANPPYFQTGDDVAPLRWGVYAAIYVLNSGGTQASGCMLPGDTFTISTGEWYLGCNSGDNYSGLYVYLQGTPDPNGVIDTDGDGIPDDEDPDADGDGVDDEHEDSDGNGIPDDEEVDSPDTTVDFKTGIPALDNLIEKLTPSFEWFPDSRSEYNLDIPLETDIGNFTMSLGGWDSVLGGAFGSIRSIVRMCSKGAFSFFFLLAIIKSLRQW